MVEKMLVIAALVLSLEEGCDKQRSEPAGPGPQFNEAKIESMCTINTFATIKVTNPHESHGRPGRAPSPHPSQGCRVRQLAAFSGVKMPRVVRVGWLGVAVWVCGGCS